MTQKELKVRDVEKLENTSAATALLGAECPPPDQIVWIEQGNCGAVSCLAVCAQGSCVVTCQADSL